MVAATGWEEGRMGHCGFVSTEFQFYKKERALETEGGDGVDALTATARYISKRLKRYISYCVHFYHNERYLKKCFRQVPSPQTLQRPPHLTLTQDQCL